MSPRLTEGSGGCCCPRKGPLANTSARSKPTWCPRRDIKPASRSAGRPKISLRSASMSQAPFTSLADRYANGRTCQFRITPAATNGYPLTISSASSKVSTSRTHSAFASSANGQAARIAHLGGTAVSIRSVLDAWLLPVPGSVVLDDCGDLHMLFAPMLRKAMRFV